MIRVLVVDDQALVRSGLAAIVGTEPGLEVVGEAADGLEAVARVAELDPDVVLMDIRMPTLDGIEATGRIVERAEGDRPRVLVLTTFDDDRLVHAALRAGACGFLLKDARPEELTDAIRTVHQGEALLAPQVLRRLIDRFVHRPDHPGSSAPDPAVPAADPGSRAGPADPAVGPSTGDNPAAAAVAKLTDRERDVLVLMARGRSNQEISAEMYVAESTVKTHVGRIFAKLGSRDRTQAVIAAYESGLLAPGSVNYPETGRPID